MGASREPRTSEKIFQRVWNEIYHLGNCVWYGKDLFESAEEHVDSIKKNLDRTIQEMKREALRKDKD